MFQAVGAEGIHFLAEAMNLPLYQSKIKCNANCLTLSYNEQYDDEVKTGKSIKFLGRGSLQFALPCTGSS